MVALGLAGLACARACARVCARARTHTKTLAEVGTVSYGAISAAPRNFY